jgi:hypothetical protein
LNREINFIDLSETLHNRKKMAARAESDAKTLNPPTLSGSVTESSESPVAMVDANPASNLVENSKTYQVVVMQLNSKYAKSVPGILKLCQAVSILSSRNKVIHSH